MKSRNIVKIRVGFLKAIFYISTYTGSISLLSSIVLFAILLANNGEQCFFYYVTSTSTIGFGLISLAFSINSIMKKSVEKSFEKSNKAKEALTSFNEICSKDEFVVLMCVTEEFRTKCAIKYSFAKTMSKEEYSLYVIKTVDGTLSGSGVDFQKFMTDLISPVYDSVVLNKSKRGLILDMSIKLNWALGLLEPISYSYVNNEFDGIIFKENIWDDLIAIYTLYLTFSHFGYFQRITNFIDLALFDIQNRV